MLLGMAGCTTPIELEIPGGYESRLVVDSRFTPDSVWSVGLQQSVPYADSVSWEDQLVTEAVVVVEGEDGFREELTHAGEGDFRSMTGSRPISEVRYTLSVDAPDLASVRASSIVPSVDAALVDFEEVASPTDVEEGVYVIRLNLHDAPGAHRYSVSVNQLRPVCYRDEGYLALSEVPGSGTEYDGAIFTSDSPPLRHDIFQVEDASELFLASEPFYLEAYFADDFFEGGTLEVALEAIAQHYTALAPYFRILVRSWSDALWRHEESVVRYDVSSYGLFSDRPVALHSNVENGLGVFGGWSGVAFFVDVEGNAWNEEDLKTGLSHVQPCREETETG